MLQVRFGRPSLVCVPIFMRFCLCAQFWLNFPHAAQLHHHKALPPTLLNHFNIFHLHSLSSQNPNLHNFSSLVIWHQVQICTIIRFGIALRCCFYCCGSCSSHKCIYGNSNSYTVRNQDIVPLQVSPSIFRSIQYCPGSSDWVSLGMPQINHTQVSIGIVVML